jgi:MOSC domain-containing protein YiiM
MGESGAVGAAGRIMAIHIAPVAGAPMQALERVRALPGLGLEGDRYAAGTGHWSSIKRGGHGLTLIESEALRTISAEYDLPLAPGETRRNLTTQGIRLDTLLGRRFRIGGAVCRGMRRCEPCSYLEDLLGKEVLYPLVHRGGIRAEVELGGEIAVGDGIVPLDD